MTPFNALLAVVFLAGGPIFPQPAVAQYAPDRPLISPWMGLWQKNTGPLDNYHSFVLPQAELSQTLQMQNNALQRQAAGLQYLNGEIGNRQGVRLGMGSTGQGATFMNYSHYYGGSNRLVQRQTQMSSSTSGQTASPNSASVAPSRSGTTR